MFGKLLKHEFRATARIIPLGWLAMTIIAGLYILANKLEIEWLAGTSIVFVVLGIIAVSLLAVGVVAVRFYQTMYKNESYLSHTLPVKTSQLLWSKALVGIVWIFSSSLLTIGGLLVLFSPLYDSNPELAMIIDMLFAWVKNVGVVPSICALLGLLILGSMESIAHIYTAITLGNLPGNQKRSFMMSVIFYIIITQVIANVCGVLTLLLPPALRFSETGLQLVMSVPIRSMVDMSQATGGFFLDFGLAGFIVQYAVDIALLFMVKKMLDKKLSVR